QADIASSQAVISVSAAATVETQRATTVAAEGADNFAAANVAALAAAAALDNACFREHPIKTMEKCVIIGT
ncbi:MAG: hypothetical protein CMM74_10825, partial [Rhodospirillaceae bacterium]|nr:hypothetical protein [Rhodospirillaceae bacterium]